MGFLRFVAVSLVLIACGNGEVGTVRPAQREVWTEPTDTIVPLPDGRLVVRQQDLLLAIDPFDTERDPVVIGPATEVGELHAAVPSDGAILVLASGGTFILRGDAWVPSPLADSFDGPIAGAVRLPTPTGFGLGELWVATARSLYRIVDGVAQRLELEDDLSDAELAVATRPEGPALWVRLPDRVLEIWRDRSGVIRTARLGLEVAPTAIGGDAAGDAFVVLKGVLHGIGPDRQLVSYGVKVDRLIASPIARESWVFGPEGTFLFAEGSLYRAEGVTVASTDALALSANGLIRATDTVQLLMPRHRVTLGGPSDRALLARPTTFPIEADGAPTIMARIDGQEVPLSPDVAAVEMNPSELGDGSHELEVLVTYDDGTLPVVVRRVFEVVTNATWENDVLPLYESYCARCHGPEGPAHTSLDEAGEWEGIFDVVLANVTDGRMPLNDDPLTQRQIATIEAWEVGGFR